MLSTLNGSLLAHILLRSQLIDEERTVCASIEKTIYLRRKQHNKPFDGHSV